MGWNVDFEREDPSHITDINNPFLQTCLKAYRDFTGDIDAPCRINAGGTYARYLPCAIETGTTLDWSKPVGNPTGHGGVHQPDESINIDGMLDALELTMLMLIECDKEKLP